MIDLGSMAKGRGQCVAGDGDNTGYCEAGNGNTSGYCSAGNSNTGGGNCTEGNFNTGTLCSAGGSNPSFRRFDRKRLETTSIVVMLRDCMPDGTLSNLGQARTDSAINYIVSLGFNIRASCSS